MSFAPKASKTHPIIAGYIAKLNATNAKSTKQRITNDFFGFIKSYQNLIIILFFEELSKFWSDIFEPSQTIFITSHI